MESVEDVDDLDHVLRFYLTDAQLVARNVPPLTILSLVDKVLPELAPANPAIARLRTEFTLELHSAPPLQLPTVQAKPSTWPRTNKEMDALWEQAMREEHEITETIDTPTGFEKAPSHTVKPFGSLNDSLLCISSYPTLDALSTVHLDYGIVADMSNQSIARLYTKLGLHVATMRFRGTLHVDIFPRRIDRRLVLGNHGTILYRQPPEFQQHWRHFALTCIEQYTACVALLTGHAVSQVYKQHLLDAGKHHDVIWM